MRKVIFQVMVSLDGFFEGPNRELDWHTVDKEFNEYAIDLLNNVDILLFGRVTYEMMARYWSSPEAVAEDPMVAGKMNNLFKIVFSKTMDKADWKNTRLVKDDIEKELIVLKSQAGKDLAILGSSNLALSLIRGGLIDEYRIIITPVVLGKGKSLFAGLHDKLKMKLLKSKTFESGNILLHYQPENIKIKEDH